MLDSDRMVKAECVLENFRVNADYVQERLLPLTEGEMLCAKLLYHDIMTP